MQKDVFFLKIEISVKHRLNEELWDANGKWRIIFFIQMGILSRSL